MKKKKALAELCDLLAEDGSVQSKDGLSSLWNQCPSLESLSNESFRPTARHVDGILAAARYLRRVKELKTSNFEELLGLIVQFIVAIPNISRVEAWPVLFTPDSYFRELLDYLAGICVKWPNATLPLSNALTEFVLNATECDPLLRGLAENFPALDPADADSLANCLLRDWLLLPHMPMEPSCRSASFQNISAYSSPIRFFFSSDEKGSSIEELQEDMSDVATDVDDAITFFTPNSTPGGTPRREPSPRKMDGNGSGSDYAHAKKRTRQLLTALELESVAAMERQELGFQLFEQILRKVEIHDELVSQLSLMAISQLGALVPYLKIRKREWLVDRVPLLSKMTMKLQASQAAASVITFLWKSGSERRSSKSETKSQSPRIPTLESVALLLDVADACISSPWRRIRSCECLFGSILSGVSNACASQGNQILRMLLLRIKSLVLATYSQGCGRMVYLMSTNSAFCSAAAEQFKETIVAAEKTDEVLQVKY